MKITLSEAAELIKAKAPAPLFIVFEGVNGSGKTSLIKAMHSFLLVSGLNALLTAEPGGSHIGKDVRRILLEKRPDQPPLSPLAELFMFSADRTQHVSAVIKPSLEAGRSVFSDRYYYSSVAFQGYGRSVDLKTITEISSIATLGLEPDLVVLLDLPVEVGLARTVMRNKGLKVAGAEEDRFEAEEISFHQRVRDGYLEQAEYHRTPFLTIDATQTVGAVAQTGITLLVGYSKMQRAS